MVRARVFPQPAAARLIAVPKEILWDYKKAPADLLWRLQRIADFFPHYGRDRETVAALYEKRNELAIDETTKLLIEEYQHAWEEKIERDKG